MGANRKFETISDACPDFNLVVHCECGHRAVLDAEKLSRWFSMHIWDQRKHMVGEHLRCTRCRRKWPKARIRIGICADLPTIDPFPKDEAGWKAKVRQLRG